MAANNTYMERALEPLEDTSGDVGRDVAAVPQALAGQDVTPPQHVGMEQPAGVDQAAGGQDQLANPEDVSLRLEGVAEATQALAAAQIATTPLTGSQDDSDIEPEPGHEPEQELGEGEGHAEQQGEGQAGAAGEAGPSTSAGAGAEGEEAKPQAKNVVRASQGGRFSGRLPHKQDELALARECELLGPLVLDAKALEEKRYTLARHVRQVASGEFRRFLLAKDAQIAQLQREVERLSNMLKAQGRNPGRGGGGGNTSRAITAGSTGAGPSGVRSTSQGRGGRGRQRQGAGPASNESASSSRSEPHTGRGPQAWRQMEVALASGPGLRAAPQLLPGLQLPGIRVLQDDERGPPMLGMEGLVQYQVTHQDHIQQHQQLQQQIQQQLAAQEQQQVVLVQGWPGSWDSEVQGGALPVQTVHTTQPLILNQPLAHHQLQLQQQQQTQPSRQQPQARRGRAQSVRQVLGDPSGALTVSAHDLLQELAQQQQQQQQEQQLVGMAGNMVTFQTGQGQNVMIPAELLSSQEDPMGNVYLHGSTLTTSGLGTPTQLNTQQMQQLYDTVALQQQQQQQQQLMAGDLQLAASPPAPPPPPPRQATAAGHAGLAGGGGAGTGVSAALNQAQAPGQTHGAGQAPGGNYPYSRLQQQLRALQQLQRQQHTLQELPLTTTMAGSTSSAGPWSDGVPGMGQQQQPGPSWQSQEGGGGGSAGGAGQQVLLAGGGAANRGIWSTGTLQGALQGLAAAGRQPAGGGSLQPHQQLAGPLTTGGMTIWESTHTSQDEPRWEAGQHQQHQQ